MYNIAYVEARIHANNCLNSKVHEPNIIRIIDTNRRIWVKNSRWIGFTTDPLFSSLTASERHEISSELEKKKERIKMQSTTASL